MTRLRWTSVAAIAASGLVLGALAFACGTDDGVGPPACSGGDCDGGSVDASPADATSNSEGSAPLDAGLDADAAVPPSCGDGGAPGTLDESFGDGGIVWLNFPGGAARDVVVRQDGKIVVVGSTAPAGEHLAVVRLMPNGSLDPSFGDGGLVEKRIGTVTHSLSSVALQGDGKIVASGHVRSTGQPSKVVLLRLLEDGSPDPTFGDGGAVLVAYAGRDAYGRSVLLGSSGRLLVGGFSEDAFSPSGTANYEVLRFNADGSLDSTFGLAGKVTVDVQGTSDVGGVAAASPSGRVVVTGGSGGAASRTSAVRLNADGTLDDSFGDAGRYVAADESAAFAATTDGFGRVVLAGSTGADIVTRRLTPGGMVDTTFGVNGMVVTDFAGRGDEAAAVLLQPDGKLVVVGQGNSGGGDSDTALEVVRLLPDGNIDATFGAGGRALSLPPANAHYGASGAALDVCSVIVVGGWASGAGIMKNAMGVARYRR